MRIPLYVKLMASYLLVVGLVVVPTTIYQRTTQRKDTRAELARDMRIEAQELAHWLSAAAPEGLEAEALTVAALRHRRVTIIAVDGRVLADSLLSKAGMENHLRRPEVQQALASADGSGSAERRSTTLNQDLFYVAQRFPLEGPARGVVRVAVPTDTLRANEGRNNFFFNQVVALALSAAVLLSRGAALGGSRPLRRVTQTARAFAAGDFGAPLTGMPADEVGDVAQAIGDLAAQLRGKLLAGGVDRATLQALLDELPVAVVIYDGEAGAAFIGAEARQRLELEPETEQARVQALLDDPSQTALVAQVLANGEARQAPLAVAGVPGQPCLARWSAVFGPDGRRRPALVLTENAQELRLARAETQLAAAAQLLRQAAREVQSPALGAALFKTALAAEAFTPLPAPRADEVECAALGDLCRDALSEVGPMLREAGVEVELVLDDATASVANATGRCERALRCWLAGAADVPERLTKLWLRDDAVEGGIRLSVACALQAQAVDDAARTLRALGGDAGYLDIGERRETWLVLPRA